MYRIKNSLSRFSFSGLSNFKALSDIINDTQEHYELHNKDMILLLSESSCQNHPSNAVVCVAAFSPPMNLGFTEVYSAILNCGLVSFPGIVA